MERKLSIDEYKQLLLLVLDEIDYYCSKHKLIYFLDSGTLLGAVRHKGYIPWDDDIDLVMPRDDYEQFIANFTSNICSVHSYINNSSYYYQYAKVCYNGTRVHEVVVPEINGLGVNIDVFPLDGMPNKKILRRIHQDHLMILGKIRTLIVIAQKNAPKPIKKCLRWKWIVRRIDCLGKKYDMYKCIYCGNIVASTVRHKEIPVNCFKSAELLEFEGRWYPAPIGYNTYLACLYGNYMCLPPEEKRVIQHNVEAYINE